MTWRLIAACVWAQWSPEQTAGWPRRHGILRVSHETIYRFIAADRAHGGLLHTQLRCRRRQRKRYGTREWRGRVRGKRPIGPRPAIVEGRTATQTRFYFATPHHAWERGTNENTNGLLRQYLPKRCDMTEVTQEDCEAIAALLNDHPRKRLDYRTPEECYAIR